MANNPTQLTILQDEIRRRYDTLSKRLKQVARYILDNSNSVAFDTVASIAQQADVPPSTLIRFANAFGFSGFNEMKQMFKQHLMEETANYTERARLFRQTTTDDAYTAAGHMAAVHALRRYGRFGLCMVYYMRAEDRAQEKDEMPR